MLSLEAVRMGSILVQILHLLAVALTHYMGTVRPLHYASTMTPFALKLVLAILWFVPSKYSCKIRMTNDNRGWKKGQTSEIKEKETIAV